MHNTTWKIARDKSASTGYTWLIDNDDCIQASIADFGFEDVLVTFEPVRGTKANYYHAQAAVARLVAMIYDTRGDTLADGEPMQVDALLLYGTLPGGVCGMRVTGRDALCTVLPCFEGAVDELMSRYY